MAFQVADRVKETSTTTGTGTLNLAGAEPGYQTFVTGIGAGNTTYYSIVNRATSEFEVGIGTVTDASPDTLSRDTIISSSNGGSAVNFSTGTKDVICTLPSEKSYVLDDGGDTAIAANLTATSLGIIGEYTFPAADGTTGQVLQTNGSGAISFATIFGDITSVTAGSGLTGGGTSGDVTLNVGAGTGVTVNADDIAIGQDVATSASPTFAGATFTANVALSDNDRIIFGTGSDLQIYHNGTNSIITDVGTGSLFLGGDSFVVIGNSDFSENFATFAANAGVNLYFDNDIKLATSATGVEITGTGTFDTGISVNNSSGYGQVEIGGNSGAYIDFKNPFSDDYDARIISDGTDLKLVGQTGVPVKLGYGLDIKLTTIATGIDVTGNVNASSTFNGSGAGLTTLNASNLASGTLPDARFPATLPTSSGANLTNLNASNVSSGTLPDARFPATLPALNGSALTDLEATNITTGLVPTARLGTGTASSTTFLAGDQTYKTIEELAVNVKDFGATGDGTTDDRAAIQSAINSISSGVVFFPAGDYLIGNNGSGVGLTLKPNVSLISFEGSSVKLLAGDNSINLLSYTNPSSTTAVSNFIISGIILSSNSKTSVTAINIDGNVSSARCSYISISDMQILGTFATGIDLRFCANTFISNLFISQSVDGLILDNCADSDIVNVKVQNGSGVGFRVLGGAGAFDEGTRLTNCSTNGQEYGLLINGADWGICSGCSFTTAPSGPLSTIGTCVHWKFTGCEFAVAGASPANPGVNLSTGCQDFIFNGCVLSLNTFGMVLRGSLHIVSGCSFEAGSNIDLYLDSTSQVVVSGNIFSSTGSTFSVFEAGSADYTNAVGNISNGTITLSGSNSASANNVTY